MGLIAFPFILCLICSPFIVGGIIFYMWWEKRQSEKYGELIQRRVDASLWCSKKQNEYTERHGCMMSNAQYEKLREEAKEKFGVSFI